MWQIIAVILGMVFGSFLSSVVKEEVKQGRKYFLISEKILLGILVLILLIFNLDALVLVGVVIGVIVCRFFKKIYFYLGIACLSSVLISRELFLSIVSLVFLFSLTNQSLEKFKLRNFVVNIIVFILPFILLSVESFINAKIGIFLGVAVGGVIEWARGSAW